MTLFYFIILQAGKGPGKDTKGGGQGEFAKGAELEAKGAGKDTKGGGKREPKGAGKDAKGGPALFGNPAGSGTTSHTVNVTSRVDKLHGSIPSTLNAVGSVKY